MARCCALLLVISAGAPLPVSGQVLPRSPAVAFATHGATPVLDVPFVPQIPALCGGAAVAMVLRYFGQRGVYAEDFAPLVVATGEGIRTDDLINAVRQRGWQAVPFAGAADLMQRRLEQGQPVIALIEDRPGRYHYVVIVAWRAGRVTIHDPARGPHRQLDENRFERAWQTTGHWAMLVLPPNAPASATAPIVASPVGAAAAATDLSRTGTDQCSTLLDAAVNAARGGEHDAAERVLLEAGELCNGAAVMVELSALRFQQRRYADAADIASAVVAVDPERTAAWDLLASSRYLLDDADGALQAWNRIDRPRNDLTRIDGLRSSTFSTVSRAIGIGSGELVTTGSLARARRRVGSLPTVQRARVDYRPVRGGDVEVQAAIAERPVLPVSVPDLLVHGVRALVDSRLRIDISNAFRVGEAWLLDWVWQRSRRSAELGFAAPDAFGARGVWQLHVADRTLTYRVATGSVQSDSRTGEDRETHRAATMSISDWVTGALQWRLSGSLDAWSGRGAFAGLVAQVQLRGWRDRVALRAARGGWWSVGGDDAFHTMRLHAAVRSKDARAPFEWSVRSGIAIASDSAPRSQWTAAGNHFATDPLLRAHAAMDDDGVMTAAFFAPRLVHAGVELRRWLKPVGPVQLGAAAFIDAATVSHVPSTVSTRTALDIGAGLRLRAPALSGAIRADAALGVTDGATALSIGYYPAWPGW